MNDRITNPDEAAAWAQPYGGVDRVEGPDANGIMTYYARNGPWVAVRRDGSFASQGTNPSAPGSAPASAAGRPEYQPQAPSGAASPEYQPQPTAPGVTGRPEYGVLPDAPPPAVEAPPIAAPAAPATAPMGLTQDQLGAYLQQVARGGDVSTLNYEHGSHQKKVTTASGQHDVYVPFVRWIDLAARRVYEYDVNDDGSYTEVKPTVTVPAAPTAASDPNAAATRNANALQAQREKNAALPPDQDPMYETDEQRDARGKAVIRQQGIDVQRAETDQRAAAVAARAAANAATPSRDEKPVTINGKPYTLVSTENPVTKRTESHYEDANHTVVQPVTEPTSPYSEVRQDPDTKKWYGLAKDGKGWTEIPGGPGATKPSGTPMPSMPEIVLGHSQDALRALKDKLQEGVAAGQWTQAQADNQWKDAYETAQTTINEATVLNSKNQAELNASTNLANARLQASTSGFNNALNFIGKLNADLPAGSTLGAKAFVGLLGLQAMSAMQSGAYSGIVPGSQTLGSPSTYRSPAQQSASSVTAAAAAVPTGGPTPSLNQGQDLSTPSAPPPSLPVAPARPVAAASASPAAAGAAPPSAASVPTTPGAPPTAITAEQVAAYERGGINPVTGDIDVRGTPTGGAPQDSATVFQAGAHPLQPGDPGYPYQPQAPGSIPPASPVPSDMPQSRTPAPANDFAVLWNAPPGVALNPVAPPSAYGASTDPQVLMHTQAASQLPWRMSPEQIAMYQRAGVPASVIWGVPGASA